MLMTNMVYNQTKIRKILPSAKNCINRLKPMIRYMHFHKTRIRMYKYIKAIPMQGECSSSV